MDERKINGIYGKIFLLLRTSKNLEPNFLVNIVSSNPIQKENLKKKKRKKKNASRYVK